MNDERPIEKLLRRYAKKRRENTGEPLEMHPATRRMLQGEVARQFPERGAAGGETTFARILMGWRARLIWAVPVVVVLGVGLWALVGIREKAGDKFQLAKRAPAPAAPVTPPAVVAESFKALEEDKAKSPATEANPADQPALAYADHGVGLEASAPSSLQPKAFQDQFAVSLADAAVRQKQSDEKAISTLAATAPTQPELKLESGRVVPNELARASTPIESRSQTLAANRSLAEPTGTIGDEQTKSLGLALAASARSDSDLALDRVRKDDVSGNQGRPAGGFANKPAALSPDASGYFYRQAARGGSEPANLQVYSQAFANRAPASTYGKLAKPGSVTPVLANFKVEQIGNQLRVIDGDGSTYVGEVNPRMEESIIKSQAEKKSAARRSPPRDGELAERQLRSAALPASQSAQNLVYRVAGTNRTLNQQVVFTWDFVELTNALLGVEIKATSGGGNVMNQVVPAQQFPVLLNNSVINGRAQLGNAKEIEINAVPVPSR